jgi:hypothetical protein
MDWATLFEQAPEDLTVGEVQDALAEHRDNE